MSERLFLPATIYDRLVVHARDQYPNEACGLLRGRAHRVVEFLPARNVSPTPRTDYEVDPESLIRALSWEDEGDELIAIFHSHPVSPAYPSLIDVARALYFDSVYLILSLQRPNKPELRGYLLHPLAIFQDKAAETVRSQFPFLVVRPGLWALKLPARHGIPWLPQPPAPPAASVLVYDQPHGPVRLIQIQPVEVSIHP